MAARALKVGTVMTVNVSKDNIQRSVPCDKGNCMLTLAGIEALENKFGKNNYRVRSTNHGMTFDINGYRILTVFDHKTGHRIYQYDEIYRKTRNQGKAKASVKPFTARLMVESCQKAPVYPPMTAETKERLKGYPRRKARTGIRTSNRRQLSE